MATQSDVAAQIMATLQASDPDLDTSIGTTTRKIIDAVSEAIGEAYVDSYMLSYQYDIDTKTDGDLDSFCRLFGIARYAAKRATGTVIFTRTVTTSALSIPTSSVVRSTGNPQVDFILVSPAIFPVGATTASAPVQAVNAGSGGNLGPSSLTISSNLPVGVTVTNMVSTSGGTEAENDDELRLRWKRTVFRSLAGTEQMYLGVALDDPDTLQANVVTAVKQRFEQLQVASGAATSTVPDAKYVLPTNVTVGSDIDLGNVFLKGLDYTWNSTNPPSITVLSAVAIPNGTIVQVEFQYTSKASRNDPANGIMSRVDVWVAGVRTQAAVQSVVFRNTITFSNVSTSPYYNLNYVRADGTHPTVGNIFIPLAFGPIVQVPTILSIAGSTWGIVGGSGSPVHPGAYQIVHDDTAAGYAGTSLFGLEWIGTAPANNSPFSIGDAGDYLYNEIPANTQAEIDRWRLLGTDVLVHQAKTIALRFNLALIYTGTVSSSSVNTAINAALSTFLTGLGFDAPVQYSDILQIVHNVPGVDSVRFLHGDDNVGWVSGVTNPNTVPVGIQKVVAGAVVQSFVDTNGRALDVIFGDNEVAGFESVFISTKAQNTFGVG